MHRLRSVRPDASASSSEELWKRAQDGDSRALNRLFARYLPRLYRWARGRVPTWARDGVDTADIVQEVLLRTLRRLDAFEPQREGAVFAYLRRALLNRIRDQFRGISRRPQVDPLIDGLDERVSSDDESPLDIVIAHSDRARYEAALKRLRPIDRQAIVASIELGYTYEQVALALDKPSAPAARLAVRRALIRLGREMHSA